MNHWVRRSLLGAGLALLVGGWGATGYAEEQQRSFTVAPTTEYPQSPGWPGLMWGSMYARPAQPRDPMNPHGWWDGYSLVPSSTIYLSGVLLMLFGGLFIGFSLPKLDK